jgi:hypothetical protein
MNMDGKNIFLEIGIGFSSDKVLQLAGTPESITCSEDGECWHYRNGKIAIYMGGEKWPAVRKLIIKRHRTERNLLQGRRAKEPK